MPKFSLVLLLMWVLYVPVLSQQSNFRKTGQVRGIVSESRSAVLPLKGLSSLTEVPNLDYYFTHRTGSDGVSKEKWVRLPSDRKWSLYSNGTVELAGRLTNGRALSDVSVESYSPSVPTATVGNYKAVAVPLTIQTTGTNRQLTITPEQIRDNFYNAPDSVNNFYRGASYGMLNFSGVLHPQIDVVPVTISATISADCQQQMVEEFTSVARQRLLDNGINTFDGSVDLGLIIFNDTPGCPPYPFATRGPLGARGVPFWVWMPESWFVTGPRILTHEIGHALGSNHPLSARCGNYDDPSTCTYQEAADRDFMTGGGLYYMYPNNFERRRWGWHPTGAFSDPITGTFQLYNLRSTALVNVKDGVRQNRFYFRDMHGAYTGWQIYPEARQNYGVFERYSGPDRSFADGIAVRYGHSNYTDPDGFSILVDPNATNSVEDAPLLQGQEISIGGNRITCLRQHIPANGTRMKIE